MFKKYISWDVVLSKLESVDIIGYHIYGVPKNGMILTAFLKNAVATMNPADADLILDDVEYTGRTRQFYQEKYTAPFISLYSKTPKDPWLVFPWEAEHPASEEGVHDNIVRIIEHIGDNPMRKGLQETPKRIVESFKEIYAGYGADIESIFKEFEDEEKYEGLVIKRDIEFFSTCEHHMLPFSGVAHIGYIPDGPVLGASKIIRLLDAFARRLQMQERIGEQVTNAMMKYFRPKGCGCITIGKHMCMGCRGVKRDSTMVYSSMKGIFLTEHKVRDEFITLCTAPIK